MELEVFASEVAYVEVAIAVAPSEDALVAPSEDALLAVAEVDFEVLEVRLC